MDELKPCSSRAMWDAVTELEDMVMHQSVKKRLSAETLGIAIAAINEKAALNRRPAPENVRNLLETIHTLRNEKAALKARYDEVNRYNISCTKEIDRLLAEKVAPENKPLTLDQLQQMDGEPVWIDGKDYGGWTIFKASAYKQVARCLDNVNLSYYMDDYGKTWLAYARKPEQEKR